MPLGSNKPLASLLQPHSRLLTPPYVCRYPVLVDPQGQGRLWLMNREEANQLKVTQLNDKMFRNHLEDCLTFGKPLLIENIEEELDPLLDAVLERCGPRTCC